MRPMDVDSNYAWLGQPRTGDRTFAELVERAIGIDAIYRCKFYTQMWLFSAMTEMDRCTPGR